MYNNNKLFGIHDVDMHQCMCSPHAANKIAEKGIRLTLSMAYLRTRTYRNVGFTSLVAHAAGEGELPWL